MGSFLAPGKRLFHPAGVPRGCDGPLADRRAYGRRHTSTTATRDRGSQSAKGEKAELTTTRRPRMKDFRHRFRETPRTGDKRGVCCYPSPPLKNCPIRRNFAYRDSVNWRGLRWRSPTTLRSTTESTTSAPPSCPAP